jgi:Second Messenger Oligonucleotide or Dinucleotide Synthetase domain
VRLRPEEHLLDQRPMFTITDAHEVELGKLTSHAAEFKDALGRIEPGLDAENAAAAHKDVATRLKADEKLKGLGVSPLLIGSYARNVSIRRVKDVDMFVRLPYATATTWPGATYDHVFEVLTGTYGDRVERQHRSIKVDFPDQDLSVDVVIARQCVDHPEDHWQIPQRLDENSNARWIETNPGRMTTLTQDANAEFTLNGKGIYVPTVKLVRQVRRTWVDKQPGGYFFEVLTWHAFKALQPEATSVAGCLTQILGWIAESLPGFASTGLDDPTMEGKTISTKATKEDILAAAATIGEAAALAADALKDSDVCSSAEKWQKLLGETHHVTSPEPVFKLPDACTVEGRSRAPKALVVPGAATVPAGRDRYA